jgi:hypothetical protein
MWLMRGSDPEFKKAIARDAVSVSRCALELTTPKPSILKQSTSFLDL